MTAARLDPAIGAVMTANARRAAEIGFVMPLEPIAMRKVIDASFLAPVDEQDGHPEVTVSPGLAVAADGTEIALRIYRPAALAGSAATVLYLHGGGMICGTLDTHHAMCQYYCAHAGVVVVSVDYRLAPENPHPTPVEDCFAALEWVATSIDDLGGDPARVAVAGDSAGGGLAAAVALLARDRGGPHLAAQVLIYPMLDDRTVGDDGPESTATWTYAMNAVGWGALLGPSVGGNDVVAYAAPARAETLADLPPTYLEIGDLDIFLAENLAYATRLAAAGVPLELHVHAGVPHGGETIAPQADVSRRIRADRVRVLAALNP